MMRDLVSTGLAPADEAFRRYGFFWRIGLMWLHAEGKFPSRQRRMYAAGWALSAAFLLMVRAVELMRLR